MACLWIGVQIDLEPAVEPKTIHLVSADAPPGCVGSLQNEERNFRGLELECAGQAGETGSNYEDFRRQGMIQ